MKLTGPYYTLRLLYRSSSWVIDFNGELYPEDTVFPGKSSSKFPEHDNYQF